MWLDKCSESLGVLGCWAAFPDLLLLSRQRLAGATLLIFANKQDLPGALSSSAIQEVRPCGLIGPVEESG